jgi:hypothetical protein
MDDLVVVESKMVERLNAVREVQGVTQCGPSG